MQPPLLGVLHGALWRTSYVPVTHLIGSAKVGKFVHWRPHMHLPLHVRQCLVSFAAVSDRTPASSRKFMTPSSVSTHDFGQIKGRAQSPAAIETEPNGGKHRSI